VTNNPAYANIAGDHARGTGALLTCQQPMQGVLNVGPSMDIVASKTIGQGKMLPAVQLGTSGPTQCEDGSYPYPNCYSSSWAGPGQPLPGEPNPTTAFNTLFQSFSPAQSAQSLADAKKRALYQKSILDYSMDQSTRLKAKLNPRDAAKVDELLSNVRDLETRLAATPMAPECSPGAAPGTPVDIRDHVTLMSNLTVLALQCGVTPVVTFSYENTVSEIQHTFLTTADGKQVTDGWHIGITHNNGDPFKIAEQQAVNTWLVTQFATLAANLKKVALPDGKTLLDHTIMVGVSDMGDQAHNHSNMIPLIVGGSALGVKTGRVTVNASEVALANVYVGIFEALGVPVTSFGDSNGKVSLL
jgi:hypothetical protein